MAVFRHASQGLTVRNFWLYRILVNRSPRIKDKNVIFFQYWCEHRIWAIPKHKPQPDASPNSTVREDEHFLRARTQSDKRNNHFLTSYVFESYVPNRIEGG